MATLPIRSCTAATSPPEFQHSWEHVKTNAGIYESENEPTKRFISLGERRTVFYVFLGPDNRYIGSCDEFMRQGIRYREIKGATICLEIRE